MIGPSCMKEIQLGKQDACACCRQARQERSNRLRKECYERSNDRSIQAQARSHLESVCLGQFRFLDVLFLSVL